MDIKYQIQVNRTDLDTSMTINIYQTGRIMVQSLFIKSFPILQKEVEQGRNNQERSVQSTDEKVDESKSMKVEGNG
jgi:hypothetical protein